MIEEPNDYITECIIHKDTGVLQLKSLNEEGWEYYSSDERDNNHCIHDICKHLVGFRVLV